MRARGIHPQPDQDRDPGQLTRHGPAAARPEFPTPGTNQQVAVFEALAVTTGAWAYRLGRRYAADIIALLDQALWAFPRAQAIVMICDNDSIHHARKVTSYLEKHPPPGAAGPAPGCPQG